VPSLENFHELSVISKGTLNEARLCLTERGAHATEIAAGNTELETELETEREAE